MKKKLKILITISLLIISNLTFAYEDFKYYDNFKDVYIVRLDNLKGDVFNRYILVFRKSDNVLLITKLCIDELIANKIEDDICKEKRIKL